MSYEDSNQAEHAKQLNENTYDHYVDTQQEMYMTTHMHDLHNLITYLRTWRTCIIYRL